MLNLDNDGRSSLIKIQTRRLHRLQGQSDALASRRHDTDDSPAMTSSLSADAMQ